MQFGEVVREELSGSTAKSYVARLTQYHRVHASPMMHESAEQVADELRAFGMDDVRIERYPSDGRRKYWTYPSAVGWTVKDAELRLVEPNEKMLARFIEVPQSLHTYSGGTPRNGVTAELVDVGKGTSDSDYRGKNVKGKFVLTTGKARPVHLEAVIKRGAAGVITDRLSYEFPGVRESTDVPDAHSYHGIWPTAEEAKSVRPGFSLTKRQGDELRRMLADGKRVKIHAKVDAKFCPGRYSIVSAAIRGSERPEDEVFMVAHLCHPKPSANDNASGCGLLLEIARTISSLIRSGRIKRPKRTIRFLWVPETVGTVVFLSKHPGLYDHLIAGINMDMVGEDQAACRSTLIMDCTPDSLPSYLNDFVFSMIGRANAEYDPMVKIDIPSNFRYTRTPHSGGSDHAEFSESTVGAPCVSLTQWPDMFYHTSMDTIDNVSEDSLRRVGWAVAVSALTLADADAEVVHKLAVLTASEGMGRISEAVEKASSELMAMKSSKKSANAGKDPTRAVVFNVMRVSHIADREAKAVRSLRRLDSETGSDAFVEGQAKAVSEHGQKELSRLNDIIDAVLGRPVTSKLSRRGLSKAERRAKEVVPRRRFKGTLDMDFLSEGLRDERRRWYGEVSTKDSQFQKKMYEAVNLMDGYRDLCEIAEFVSAEYGPTDVEHLLRFVDDLKAMDLVTF